MRRQPFSAAATSAMLSRSPTRTSAPAWRSEWARSSSRRTNARTGWPCSSSMSTIVLLTAPISPAAPVIRVGLRSGIDVSSVWLGWVSCSERSSGHRAVDAAEEVEEHGVDLCGTLLLCPVGGSRQYHRAVQSRYDIAQRAARSVRVAQGRDHVTVSHHVQRRNVDPAPPERREQFVVAFDVPVPV